MKRDMTLIREILIQLEADDSDPLQAVAIAVEGYSERELMYHFRLLGEADLIDALNTSSADTSRWHAQRLTWHGHEFLDAARDETIWQAALDKIAAANGTASFAIMTEILLDLNREKLGLKT